MTTVILYYNRDVLQQKYFVNFKLCIAHFVNSATFIFEFFCYESQLQTNLYLPGSFAYYVISRGVGEFPNDYASVILTQ